MEETAVITGITGQDGSYLAKNLISKGIKVIGVVRPTSYSSKINLQRHDLINKLELVSADITDRGSIERLISSEKPKYFYNLAAQSFVGSSFHTPALTTEINANSVLRILECLRNFSPSTRFYQASTSEMFGKVKEVPQTEDTPFCPRSPYGVSKLYSHWITINYRESYNLFAVSGILFNHESPIRGTQFVTRKIVNHLARLKHGYVDNPLLIGNLEAKRDWGHADDYTKGMIKILESEKAEEYILATGENHSIRDFVNATCMNLGFEIEWEGIGLNEKGIEKVSGKKIVEVSKEFFRPCEVDELIGDPSKAESELKWERKYSFQMLVEEMCRKEIDLLNNNIIL